MLAQEAMGIMNTQERQEGSWKLFLAVFASAFALFFGLIILGMMAWPVIASVLIFREPYQPALPISEAAEQGSSQKIDISGKQLYPPLPQFAGSGVLPDGIRIPSIEVDVPLVMSASIDDAAVLATLDKGAALYPNGILPGRLGNVFIAAHSTGEPWKGAYRFAFLRINELESGNLIHLDHNGARYTYTVREKEIVTPSSDYRIVSDRPVPTMTLMACWPLWSTQKRMLIHADLTNVTKLSPTPATSATAASI